MALNTHQKQAVQVNQGAALVLAGAGSGKTRVLTERFVRLVAEGLASPEAILAVTFTNKAAREMAHRIKTRLNKLHIPIRSPLWVTTFHSCCAKILRFHAELLGYEKNFTIYDDTDALALIKKILKQLNINDKFYPPKAVKSRIQEAKGLALKPNDPRVQQRFDKKSQQIYALYEKQLKLANAMDFNDLLVKTLQLFRQHVKVLELYQDQFQYIMVDEYQDTNHIQYLLVKQLAQKYKNIFAVGDEDQSIYSWRGADISNILNFEKDFQPCQKIKLEQNYRSTKTIIQAASKMIQNNTQRHDKVLFSEAEQGSLIGLARCRDEYAEAKFVAKNIQKTTPQQYHNCAVFYRTNAQSRALEEELRERDIPYKLVGGVKFYSRKEVKDLICYLRLALNPHDDAALKRVINTPLRGIGATSQESIENYGIDHGLSLYAACNKMLQAQKLGPAAERKIFGFLNLINQAGRQAQTSSLSELYLYLVDTTEYVKKLKLENTQESLSRIENLDELHNAIIKFEETYEGQNTLNDFLEKMSLLSEEDDTPNSKAVWLMTLHAAKGLEFDHVFMVGNEEGLFPGQQSLDDAVKIEEERRLFYVGMTRARKNLFLSHTRRRTLWGTVKMFSKSRFVDEIPNKFVKKMSLHKVDQVLEDEGDGSFSSAHDDPFSVEGGGPMEAKKWDVFPDYEMMGPSTPAVSASVSTAPVPAALVGSGGGVAAAQALWRGQWVRHARFGLGQVVGLEGHGDRQRVRVRFQSSAPKTFISKFAKLRPVAKC